MRRIGVAVPPGLLTAVLVAGDAGRDRRRLITRAIK